MLLLLALSNFESFVVLLYFVGFGCWLLVVMLLVAGLVDNAVCKL